MWARKRIDIGYRDLLRALRFCVFPSARSKSQAKIRDTFSGPNAVVCLSVRSGFDLLVQSLDWEQGSEIVFSGLTIADMPRIAAEHGLKSIGVDLSLESLEPILAEIEENISPKTKAIVVAHLMGGRCDLDEIAKLAKKHDLLLIEDCAQAYSGNEWTGSLGADVSMFSFGTIKTNTSLGGGVLFLADNLLASRIRELHRSWPVQSRHQYAKRVLKYGFIKLISANFVVAMLCFLTRKAGLRHDEIFSTMTKGFSGSNFFQCIRHQPSNALLSMLSVRLARFQCDELDERANRGSELTGTLQNTHSIPGIHAISQTYWVFPILAENRQELTQLLWKHGFDATNRSSLISVTNARNKTAERFVERFLSSVIFLPIDYPMPDREVIRLAMIINRNARPLLTEEKPCAQANLDTEQVPLEEFNDVD